MGLSLWCDSINVRVGSYSQVHMERRHWIEAVIKYLKDNNIDTKLEEELDNWIGHDTIHSGIEYINVSDKPSVLLKKYNLEGLYKFVNHSDCEGFLTPYESELILDTLKKIIKYLKNETNIEDHYLYPILDYSIKNKTNIEFC